VDGPKLDLEKRTERLNALRLEFKSLIEFHAIGFKDLDDKARYWLTVTLPSFLALFGYLIKEQSVLDMPLLCAGYSLATWLVTATYYFSSVLLSQKVESGILSPPNRDFSEVKPMIEDDDKWSDLADKQVGELLRALQINESGNRRKSTKLSRAERSLFRAAPVATILAAAAGVIGTTATAGVGIAIGAAVTAAFLGFRHNRPT